MNRSARLLPVLVALTCPPLWADTVDARFPRQQRHPDNMFTRIFPELPPFAAQTDRMRNAAALLGAREGPLDARDNLTDPVQSIVNQPVFSPNNADNAAMTAGVTFFGQFLDHDVTFDRRSVLLANAAPRARATSGLRRSTWTACTARDPNARPSCTTPAAATTSSGSTPFRARRQCRAQARCATTCRATRTATR